MYEMPKMVRGKSGFGTNSDLVWGQPRLMHANSMGGTAPSGSQSIQLIGVTRSPPKRPLYSESGNLGSLERLPRPREGVQAEPPVEGAVFDTLPAHPGAHVRRYFEELLAVLAEPHGIAVHVENCLETARPSLIGVPQKSASDARVERVFHVLPIIG